MSYVKHINRRATMLMLVALGMACFALLGTVWSQSQPLATRDQLWIAATVATSMGISGDFALDLVENSDPPADGVLNAFAVPIEKYTDGDDNWSPEIQAFLDDPNEPAQLLLGQGPYHMKEGVTICREVEIRGQSRHKVTITAPGDITPFHIAANDTSSESNDCPEGTTGKGGNYSVFRNLRLSATDDADGKESFGFLIERRATLDHVHVIGFANGVRIDAGAQRRDPSTNANTWLLNQVVVEESSHAAIYVDGPDANAGTAINVSAAKSCTQHTMYDLKETHPTWLPCAGIVDSSFLGNSWISAHTATNNSQPGYIFGDIVDVGGGVLKMDLGTTQRSVCIGCYAEDDQADSMLTRRSIAFGGASNWSGDETMKERISAGVYSKGRNWHNMTLTTPIIVTDPNDANPRDILMRWYTHDNERQARIEVTETGFRGSDQGVNRQTAWEWDMDDDTFIPKLE